MKFKGFDDFAKKLQKKLDEASGNVGINELLHDGFMRLYTDFQNSQEFFDDFPIKFEGQEEWDKIDEEEKDKFVKERTRFQSWSAMIEKAGEEYLKRKIKF